MKTGILFDLDGTLLDTLQDLTDSVNYVLRQYGCPERTLCQVRSYVGTGARRLIEQALPGREDDPDVSQVLESYQIYYKAHSQVKTKPYEGILQALAELKEKYPLAVVSNKPDAATKLLCREYFGDIFAMGEHPGCARKPAPDMLYKVMESIGVETCIYVGDSDVDVVTARNANVPCLSVLWGFRDREEITRAGGTNFCEEPGKLAQTLKKMLESME